LEDEVNQPALNRIYAEGATDAIAPASAGNVVWPFAKQGAPDGITGDSVRLVCELRRKRMECFPQKLFGDPTWEILLQLYAAHLDGRQLSVTRLTRCSRVALTTVLRRLGVLENEGLVTRTDDAFDGRRVNVGLSFFGAEAMHRCFAASGNYALSF
jgi:DNA-binding MarR family transcriptional regulator